MLDMRQASPFSHNGIKSYGCNLGTATATQLVDQFVEACADARGAVLVSQLAGELSSAPPGFKDYLLKALRLGEVEGIFSRTQVQLFLDVLKRPITDTTLPGLSAFGDVRKRGGRGTGTTGGGSVVDGGEEEEWEDTPGGADEEDGEPEVLSPSAAAGGFNSSGFVRGGEALPGGAATIAAATDSLGGDSSLELAQEAQRATHASAADGSRQHKRRRTEEAGIGQAELAGLQGGGEEAVVQVAQEA
ncbi:oxidoreductase [Micractinium conductrix]|uniref:Oxidoreductase n=1 Tax=Micractinium conductrix TaxID=554055 RepID=A0A2P6V834_9CHLO|nr:oxidoreductase [Micractinium conductrix]|eukprot:PSC70254.1 oxidoreductase [Micractinium conductrix]